MSTRSTTAAPHQHYGSTTAALQQHYSSTTAALQQHYSSTTVSPAAALVLQQHYSITCCRTTPVAGAGAGDGGGVGGPGAGDGGVGGTGAETILRHWKLLACTICPLAMPVAVASPPSSDQIS
jgi:hypothetical protein